MLRVKGRSAVRAQTLLPSEAGEASQGIGAPMIAGIDRHHSREYHQTYKNPSAAGRTRSRSGPWEIYWHTILWNLCRLNSDGQAKRP
jgi:hypothetical protein